jgi:hypothetical protein
MPPPRVTSSGHGPHIRPRSVARSLRPTRAEGSRARHPSRSRRVWRLDGAPSPEERLAKIGDEPPLTGDDKLDAVPGAAAEYLEKLDRLPQVPEWVGGPKRVLAEPYFTTRSTSPGMREFLTFSSPAEFRWRNTSSRSVLCGGRARSLPCAPSSSVSLAISCRGTHLNLSSFPNGVLSCRAACLRSAGAPPTSLNA